ATTALPASAVLIPTPREGLVLVKTVAIGVGAVLGSFGIALPAVFALAHARGRATRCVLYAAIIWPLLAPPCVIAYAWNLLATQKTWLAEFMVNVLCWQTRGMAPVVAAWLQATWL